MSGTDTAGSHSNYGAILLAPNTSHHDDSTSLSEGDFHELSLLYEVQFSRDLDTIKFLLNSTMANASLIATRVRGNGMNALHNITSLGGYGYYEIVDLLIDHAENRQEYVTKSTDDGNTALHYAAKHPEVEVVDRLINEAGTKDNYIAKVNRNRETAIHLAAHCGNLEVVKRLIDLAEDKSRCINVKDRDGWTALHYAVYRGHSDIVSFLLEQKANPSLKNRSKMTAWDIALSKVVGDRWWWDFQRRDTLGRMAIWEVIAAFVLCEPVYPIGGSDPRAGHTKLLFCNNLAMAYITLRPIAKDIATSSNADEKTTLARIISQVHREFNENRAAHLDLRSREPSCIVQPLEYSGDANRKPYNFVSLVVPFLHIDDWSIIQSRKDDFVHGGIKCCVGVNHDFPKGHTTLTLDEYCKPALPPEILEARNRDQVLGRYKEARPQKNDPPQARLGYGKDALEFLNELWVLMKAYMSKIRKKLHGQQLMEPAVDSPPPKRAVFVRQAWIWKIGDSIIIHLPSRMCFQYDINDTSPRLGDSLNYILYVLRTIVKDLDNPSTPWSGLVEPDEPIVKTFENALSIISEKVNQYVKKARVEDIDLEKEKELFHEIRDLREELSMIKSVLAEQEEVFNEFISSILPNQRHAQQPGNQRRIKPRDTTNTGPSRSYRPQIRYEKIMGIGQRLKLKQSRKFEESASKDVLWLQATFYKHQRQIAKLEQDAERVEQDVSTQLDLKQKHATMREAHSLGILSAAVFGFTVITVIYTPLSFVAALFALPIDQFNEGKNGDKDGVYSSEYIRKWSVTAELVSISVTLAAMWAALQFTGLHLWGNNGLREHIRRKAQEIHAAGEAPPQIASSVTSSNRSSGEENSRQTGSDGTRSNRTMGEQHNSRESDHVIVMEEGHSGIALQDITT
ncbi:hypothetical protein NUW58_g6255 [Xylaria curta]|uniref:Uncharacterized protein n=1 Tax=Xylaria curta TaxID=42375 RepID=A0ACC1NXU3_9PEZI|nr:hypothetical protein NUW58_g6255 [Xylaria curta]